MYDRHIDTFHDLQSCIQNVLSMYIITTVQEMKLDKSISYKSIMKHIIKCQAFLKGRKGNIVSKWYLI